MLHIHIRIIIELILDTCTKHFRCWHTIINCNNAIVVVIVLVFVGGVAVVVIAAYNTNAVVVVDNA